MTKEEGCRNDGRRRLWGMTEEEVSGMTGEGVAGMMEEVGCGSGGSGVSIGMGWVGVLAGRKMTRGRLRLPGR